MKRARNQIDEFKAELDAFWAATRDTVLATPPKRRMAAVASLGVLTSKNQPMLRQKGRATARKS